MLSLPISGMKRLVHIYVTNSTPDLVLDGYWQERLTVWYLGMVVLSIRNYSVRSWVKPWLVLSFLRSPGARCGSLVSLLGVIRLRRRCDSRFNLLLLRLLLWLQLHDVYHLNNWLIIICIYWCYYTVLGVSFTGRNYRFTIIVS
jgi:hypothetical protein